MASSWTVVAGTVLGASIGIVQAEVIRYRGARDAAAERAEQLREDRERLLERREFIALQRIVGAVLLLPPISKTTDPSADTVESIREFARRVAYACLQLRDEQLRLRLLVGVDAVDLAKDGQLPPFSLGEAVYIVRQTFRVSIGAAMRKEPMPNGSHDWRRLWAATFDGLEVWRAARRADHFDAHLEYDGLRRWQFEDGDADMTP